MAVLKRLRKKSNLRLSYRGELWEVNVEGEFCDTPKSASLSLTRVRDLTRVRLPSGLQFSFGQMFSLQQDPTFLLALMIAFLAALFCLPGVGDQAGTAPKVSRAVKRRGPLLRSLTFPSRSW